MLHNNFLLSFEVLPQQTRDSIVQLLAGSFIKIMISAREPQRLHTAAKREIQKDSSVWFPSIRRITEKTKRIVLTRHCGFAWQELSDVHTQMFTPRCSHPNVHTQMFTPRCSHHSHPTSFVQRKREPVKYNKMQKMKIFWLKSCFFYSSASTIRNPGWSSFGHVFLWLGIFLIVSVNCSCLMASGVGVVGHFPTL